MFDAAAIAALTREMSPGLRDCLKLLIWYWNRHGRVHPSQEKLAKTLKVSDRQVRTYLRQLRDLGFLKVRQGGNGRTASYTFTSELTSGLLPGCFRAEKAVAAADPTNDHQLTDENFRAETGQLSSLSSSCSNQSECTGLEPAPRPISQNEYRTSQREAVERAITTCGIEPTPALVEKLARKAQFYGVTGFVVAAHISRGWKRIAAQPSNHPRKPAWILKVVEEELARGCEPHQDHRQASCLSEEPHNGQVGAAAADELPETELQQLDHQPEQRPQLLSVAPLSCTSCKNNGLFETPGAAQQWIWCTCAHAVARRRREPNLVDETNAKVMPLRRIASAPLEHAGYHPRLLATSPPTKPPATAVSFEAAIAQLANAKRISGGR